MLGSISVRDILLLLICCLKLLFSTNVLIIILIIIIVIIVSEHDSKMINCDIFTEPASAVDTARALVHPENVSLPLSLSIL